LIYDHPRLLQVDPARTELRGLQHKVSIVPGSISATRLIQI